MTARKYIYKCPDCKDGVTTYSSQQVFDSLVAQHKASHEKTETPKPKRKTKRLEESADESGS